MPTVPVDPADLEAGITGRRRFPLVDMLLGYPTTGPRPGAPPLMTHGVVIELFTDRACTVPADAVDLAGNPITSVTIYGVQLPEFYGPDTNATTLFGRPAGASGDGFPIYASDPAGSAAAASFDPSRTPELTATNMQGAIEELYAMVVAGGGGAFDGGTVSGDVVFTGAVTVEPGTFGTDAVAGLDQYMRERLTSMGRPPLAPFNEGETPDPADYEAGTVLYERATGAAPVFGTTLKFEGDDPANLETYTLGTSDVTTAAQAKARFAFVFTGKAAAPGTVTPASFNLWGLTWTPVMDRPNDNVGVPTHRVTVYRSFGIPADPSDRPVVAYGAGNAMGSCTVYVLEADALKGTGIRTVGTVPQIGSETNVLNPPRAALPAPPLAGNPIVMFTVQNNTTHTLQAGPGFVFVGTQLTGTDPSRKAALQLDAAPTGTAAERSFASDAGGSSIKITGIMELDLV